MARKHVWRVREIFFRKLKSGEKRIEVRVGYSRIRAVRRGDIVIFEGHDADEFDVKRITLYNTFADMLKTEGVEHVLPDMSFESALKVLRSIYSEEKEALGVYAFDLVPRKVRTFHVEFLMISDLMKSGNRKKFAELIAEVYKLTDWICEDYPNHCDHFYRTYVPGIFDGTREIVVGYVGSEIAAIVILKKTNEERKLSTIYVRPKYRKCGIASAILDKSFVWLETTRPLLTIADYKLGQFAGLIKKYGWVETQILAKGYYNNHSCEHVFNG